MIKKGLLILLLLWTQGCVGTVKLAHDNNNDNRTSQNPVITKGSTSSTKNQ